MSKKKNNSNMTLTAYSIIDDISKYCVMDPFFDFEVRKMNIKNTSEHISFKREVLSKIITDFLKSLNYDKTVDALISHINNNMQTNIIFDLSNLKKQMQFYLQLLSSKSDVEVSQSFRYESATNEIKVTARKTLDKNYQIECLIGKYTKLNLEEEAFINSHKIDFSIMTSQMRKCSLLLLGPAALVNHDCDPNSQYVSKNKNTIFIKTVRNIKKGEEITCYYGEDYFELGNSLCQCKTCETNGNGFFKKLVKDQYDDTDYSKNILESHQNKSFQVHQNEIILNNKSFHDKLVQKITSNKTFIDSLKIERNNFTEDSQRRISNTTNKVSKSCDTFEPMTDDIYKIVEAVYKNNHASSTRSVKKFIESYKREILEDVKGVKDGKDVSTLLAPQFKEMQDYFVKLVTICLSVCFEEFSLCIYKNEKLSPALKKRILENMNGGRDPTRQQKSKLDNCLNMYSIYLQGVVENILSDLLKDVTSIDETNSKISFRHKTLLSSLTKDFLCNDVEKDLTCITSSINYQKKSQQGTPANTSQIVSRNSITEESASLESNVSEKYFNDGKRDENANQLRVSIVSLDYSCIASPLDDSSQNESSILKNGGDALSVEKINEIIGITCPTNHENSNSKPSKALSKNLIENTNNSVSKLIVSRDGNFPTRELKVAIKPLSQEEVNNLENKTLSSTFNSLCNNKSNNVCKNNASLTENKGTLNVKSLVNKASIGNTQFKSENRWNNIAKEKEASKTEINTLAVTKDHKPLKKFQKGTLNENILAVMNSTELYVEDNKDEQVTLFRKLVLLNFVKRDTEIEKYMMYRKVSRNIKQKILQFVYDNDFQEIHFAYLDLLMPCRYLIRKQYNYLVNLMKGNIKKELYHLQSFSDIENIFYEGKFNHSSRKKCLLSLDNGSGSNTKK